MRIVYLSLTGNIRSFVKDGLKIDDAIELDYYNPRVEINEDYILIVPSYDDGITDLISDFIDYKNNLSNLVAIVGSGNRNFDEKYCFNAVDLSRKYNKPLIFKFEFSGTQQDVENFKKEVNRIAIARTKQES